MQWRVNLWRVKILLQLSDSYLADVNATDFGSQKHGIKNNSVQCYKTRHFKSSTDDWPNTWNWNWSGVSTDAAMGFYSSCRLMRCVWPAGPGARHNSMTSTAERRLISVWHGRRLMTRARQLPASITCTESIDCSVTQQGQALILWMWFTWGLAVRAVSIQ